ncbi:Rv3235 family protein [Streptomyces sp. NPDC059766]|uniref:Rv3235 family protein n=1 Tax=Streptomyces sp. NPDC059766 TaxID=3346940 RepID=UPI0036482F2F
MNKVMTRTRRHTGSRPPVRHDTRRPGTGPARTAPGTGPSRTPAATAPAPASRVLPGAPASPSTSPAPAAPAVPAGPPHRQVPQPRPTDVFAERLLAVLSGLHPVHRMLRHTAGRAYDELAWLAEHAPLRGTRGSRPVVRDIGYYVPRPGAVEAFARIGAGDRLRAMAFRLELGADRRWRCTAVELGGPRRPRTDDC